MRFYPSQFTKHTAGLLLTGLALVACSPKFLLGEFDSTDASSGGATGDGETSSGSSSAGTADTTGAGTTGAGTTGEGSGGLPEACLPVDHQSCFDAALAACEGQGNWDVTPACVDAVQSCYPLGTQVLAPADVVSYCKAELHEECQYENAPGCSEDFCACTAGAYPFDWNNCWHLPLVACAPGVASDCETVLAGCYPAATIGDYEQCKEQVVTDIGYECDCPMCGKHEQCEDALDACLAP